MEKIVTNRDLTKEEVDELASSLIDLNLEINDETEVLPEKELSIRFERAMAYVRSQEDKFFKMTIEDIFKWFFFLGVNTEIPCGKSLSLEDVMRFIENEEFIEMVSNGIKDPSTLPKSTCVNLDDVNNVVRLEAECDGYDCACSPQREDHCMSEDAKKCVITIPMKRFNELIGVNNEPD